MKLSRITLAFTTFALLFGVLPLATSASTAVTVGTKPGVVKTPAKVSPSHVAITKTTPPKKAPAKKKVVVKKKPARKHKVIVQKHKPFLMLNAPLLDPKNPPSSPG